MIPRLDLHGVKHVDVRRKCDTFMTQIWGSYDCVDIITGNSDQMRKMVVSALSDYDVEISMSLQSSSVLRIYL